MSKTIGLIKKNLKSALKKSKAEEILTLRGLLAALQNRQIEIGKQKPMKEDEVISVLQKEAKKRKEAIEAYQQARREDLANKEKTELRIIEKYLPKLLGEKEILRIIKDTIQKTNAAGTQDFGKVMGVVMGRLKGKAEGSQVRKLVEKELNS